MIPPKDALVLSPSHPSRTPLYFLDLFVSPDLPVVRIPIYDCVCEFDLDDDDPDEPEFDFLEKLTADSVRAQLSSALYYSQQFPPGFVQHYVNEILPDITDAELRAGLFYYQ